MSVIRAILAALIAISLVVVPAMPADLASMSGVEMAMGDQGDTPCCPCCDTQDNSKASVSCAIKCISVFVAMLPLTAPLPDAVKAAPIAGLADALREHVRSPPTHPPPV